MIWNGVPPVRISLAIAKHLRVDVSSRINHFVTRLANKSYSFLVENSPPSKKRASIERGIKPKTCGQSLSASISSDIQLLSSLFKELESKSRSVTILPQII